MSDTANKALLPAGLRDVLAPDAAIEATTVERLMSCFTSNGYDRVKPPLVEFEDNLLSGSGAALADQTFRFMDPQSRRMLGVRADQTLQVARIGTTRLVNQPRPLRLSYAGQVLRVKGSQLRPERQFAQAGIELMGSSSIDADAEVILVTVQSLIAIGVKAVTVDINLPILVPMLFEELNVPQAERAQLREALDHKDIAIASQSGAVFADLIRSVGPVEAALEKLEAAIDIPGPKAEVARLKEVISVVRREAPDLVITLDPVEHRGFEYHTGVSFAIFAQGAKGDLGRGGRYMAGNGETAVGATLFMDTALSVLARPEAVRRVYLPVGTPRADARRLQDEGWVTVNGLGTDEDPGRLACGYIYKNGQVAEIA